ncbi:hypothetical protein MasN3_26570 [Massilia varians]|uniref:IstB-like ATP-binding domain-containing protein n=1 Tax=Massilia varians TaxID=457921 RepID=A0ABN6TF07_9BURK|nr:ATP-binding protein [Massilia varians]BDT59163.1 hypothetical protein MasN3_26570 [Massilia varians]
MTMNEIERALRELLLSGIRAALDTRVSQDENTQEPFLGTSSLILEHELDRRRSCLMDQRYKQSALDERMSLEDFDWRFNAKLSRAACFEPHTLKLVAEGQNALILGRPGSGESHIAKAVAYQAHPAGHNVRYLEADEALATYALGGDAEQRQQLCTLVDAARLVLKDLFLARRISDKSGELLQTLVHQRYKLKCSIVVTSDLMVQNWGKYLGDNSVATTFLGRLMLWAHILELRGKATGSRRQPNWA